jgi:serine protease Do
VTKLKRRIKIILAFSIIALGLVAPSAGWQDSDEGSRIYNAASKSVFLILAKSSDGKVVSQGTGFLIAGNKIVTNDHVVSTEIVVLDLGAAKLALTVGLRDPVNDLVVLTPAGELSAEPLALAEAPPSTGMRIYAIGNPQGLERSISAGIVGGVRDFKGRSLLQITSPISPGSSGGPILNQRGEVIGVAVGSLEGGQNLNFAVPVKALSNLVSGVRSEKSDLTALLQRTGLFNRTGTIFQAQ